MPEIALLEAFAVVEARTLATVFALSIALLVAVLNEFVTSLTSDRTLPETPEVVRLLVGSLVVLRLRLDAFSLVVVLEISSVFGSRRGAPPLGRA